MHDNNKRDDANRILEQYSGKSENELYAELMRTTDDQKQNGSFDMEGLNEFESTIMPMLNDKQKEKLEKLMSALRKDNTSK